jgi:hypothetical protein
MRSVEQSEEWELAGETEVPSENVPPGHFFHHKSHMGWNPGRCGEKSATNRLSYGTANISVTTGRYRINP